jgi:cation diffusion facilitator family transporter
MNRSAGSSTHNRWLVFGGCLPLACSVSPATSWSRCTGCESAAGSGRRRLADGVHARTDGFTSLAVVLGVVGVWLGFPLADPIIGLLISIVIFVLLWGTARDLGRRLLDGVDPALVHQAEQAVRSIPGINDVKAMRMRWSGHTLDVEATVATDPAMPVGRFHELEHAFDHRLREVLPNLRAVRLTPSVHETVPSQSVGSDGVSA